MSSQMRQNQLPPYPGTNYRWHLVGMLWLVSFFNYADRQAIFAVFPLLGAHLHLDLVQLGLIGSAFAWVYGLAAPVSGYLVDRLRRKTAILGGLQLWSWICAATALASRLWTLVTLRAAMGLGESLYFPASLSMMSDYHGPDTRSRALGLHQTSVYAGTIVGGFFAGWIAERYSWRWPFVCFGGAGVLLAFLLIRLLIEPERGAMDREPQTGAIEPPVRPLRFFEFVRVAARIPSVWLLMGAFACANFVAMVLLAWMPSFLFRRFHFDLAMSGLTATVFAQTGSMAGTMIGGWQADRLVRKSSNGRVLVQAAGVLCGAPFVLLCGQARSVAVLLVALSAWGLFKGLYDANIFASLFDVVPIAARGTAVGWMNIVGWLGGGGLAPLLTGLLASRYGLGIAVAITSVVYLMAGALLLYAAFRTIPHDHALHGLLTENTVI